MILRYLAVSSSLCLGLSAAPPPNPRRGAIELPDHLDGIPLERDGGLNHAFRQEVLVGELKLDSKQDVRHAIKALFAQADSDKDDLLSEDELENVIHTNTMSHLSQSMREVADSFATLDADRDEQLSWREYANSIRLSDDDQPQIMIHESPKMAKEREVFARADADNSSTLSRDEWTGLLHPELLPATIEKLAQELMTSFDADKNGMVSLDEFIGFAESEEVEQRFDGIEAKEKAARTLEFQRDLDANGDGYATLTEFIAYVNPLEEGRHRREVGELLWQIDANEDGRLSLAEMLQQDVFLRLSPLMSAGRRFHEDL